VSASNEYPAYLGPAKNELGSRGKAMLDNLGSCTLCPRRCGVNRLAGEIGFCKIGAEAMVSSFGPHFGEERPLVGLRGSGTVFFAGCNLGCLFCQNSEISHYSLGSPASPERLASVFLEIQAVGCHNLNLVTPTHVAPQILIALDSAVKLGFKLPIVWNTGGYESPESLKALDGVVDIYMPDFKMWNSETASKLLQAVDYPEIARAAVEEMHRQVGDLDLDESGVARRGMIVRHLVLPNGLSDTAEVAEFIAGLSTQTYFNLMDQYRPCHMAEETDGIERILLAHEFKDALAATKAAGLKRLD
jgi:putative pyruvate formate lyase activating enzyme